jgi:hypothetical protein
MRRLGRFQFPVRRLLLLPAILAFSWWLAIEAIEGQSLRELARCYEHEEAAYESMARAPIPEYYWEDDGCFTRGFTGRKRSLTEAELKAERRAREQAARLAAYHHALKVKYTWAAWIPWLPVAADPLPPE